MKLQRASISLMAVGGQKLEFHTMNEEVLENQGFQVGLLVTIS